MIIVDQLVEHKMDLVQSSTDTLKIMTRDISIPLWEISWGDQHLNPLKKNKLIFYCLNRLVEFIDLLKSNP